MTMYRAGDVVLVEIIFAEGIGAKKRPALVISSDLYNTRGEEVIVAAITSNIKRMLPGDTKCFNWKIAGLLFPSVVTGILQTVKQSIITRKLGLLSKEDYENVRSGLASALSIIHKGRTI